ncbi:MAG: class I SAM-dependent methyltransferase, partial [Candidatus Omnitrophota bacterium]
FFTAERKGRAYKEALEAIRGKEGFGEHGAELFRLAGAKGVRLAFARAEAITDASSRNEFFTSLLGTLHKLEEEGALTAHPEALVNACAPSDTEEPSLDAFILTLALTNTQLLTVAIIFILLIAASYRRASKRDASEAAETQTSGIKKGAERLVRRSQPSEGEIGGTIGRIATPEGQVLTDLRGRVEMGQFVLSHPHLRHPLMIDIDEEKTTISTDSAIRQILSAIDQKRLTIFARGTPDDTAVISVLTHAQSPEGLPIYIIRDNPHAIFCFAARRFICINEALLNEPVLIFHAFALSAGLDHHYLRGASKRDRFFARARGEAFEIGLQDKLFGQEANNAAAEKIRSLKYIHLVGRGVSLQDFISLTVFELSRTFGLPLESREDRETFRRTVLEIVSGTSGITVETQLQGGNVLRLGSQVYPLGDSVVIPYIVNPEIYFLTPGLLVEAVYDHRDELATLLPKAEQALVREDKNLEIRLGNGSSLGAYRAIARIYKRVMAPVVASVALNVPAEASQPLGDRELRARIAEGSKKLTDRLRVKGAKVSDDKITFSKFIAPLLSEGASRAALSEQPHNRIIRKLQAYMKAKEHYLVAEALREYFHILVQERGINDPLYSEIFEKGGEPLWADWAVMGRLGKLRSDKDHSHAMLLRRIDLHLVNSPNRRYRVLVVGAGSGRLVNDLVYRFGSRLQIVETDPEIENIIRSYGVNTAGNHPQQVIHVPADAANLECFAESTFDITISHGALRYFSPATRQRAAVEMARVTKPDGVIIASDVLQRHTWQTLVSDFATDLTASGLGFKIYGGAEKVFRNTTFYNCLFQYLHPDRGEYNRIFRDAVDAISASEKKEPIDILFNLAGYKEGHVRVAVIARKASII